MGKLRPFVRKDSYMPNKKWIPFVIGNGYTTTDGASGPAPEWETVTGNPVTFNAITPFPLRQLSVAFSPVQEGSGDPSPDNVRPISGWDLVNVRQTSTNVADGVEVVRGAISGMIGADATSTTRLRTGYIFVSAGTYTIYAKPDLATVVRVYDTDKTFIANEGDGATWHSNGRTITFTGDRYIRLMFSYNMGEQTEIVPSDLKYLNVSDVHRSISISLGSTVYSGYVDVVTGVVTVTMASVDLGSLSWLVNSETANIFMAKVNGMAINPDSESRNIGFVISAYKPSSIVSISINMNDKAALRNGGYVFIRDTSYSDKDVFAASVSGVQLVYELATPIPISLTPQEVQSLAGDNTMWTDAASLTVEYRSN